MMSAQVFNTRPLASTTDWLKLKPFKLKAIVDRPKAVNQIPTTGHAARKKCNERELLNDAYWNLVHSFRSINYGFQLKRFQLQPICSWR